jgi:hypothetical protein
VHKKFASQSGDLLKRAGLLEEVRSAGDDLEPNWCFHVSHSLFVQLDDDCVATADQEQCRSSNVGQFFRCQIRAPAPRHDRINAVWPSRRHDQCCATASACSEESNRESACVILGIQPAHCANQPISEEPNVEANVSCAQVDLLLIWGEQVEKEGSKIPLPQFFGDVSVPGRVAAASAPVGEHDQTEGARRDRQFAFEGDTTSVNYNGSLRRICRMRIGRGSHISSLRELRTVTPRSTLSSPS